MEHMNDNGPRQEETSYEAYDAPPPRRYHRRSMVLPIILAFIAGCIFASVGWSAIAGLAMYQRTNSTLSNTSSIVVLEMETTAIRETQTNLPVVLTPLTPVRSHSAFNVLDVDRLNIESRNGSVILSVHDSPYIRLNVSATLDNGTLSVANRNQQLRIYLPHNEAYAVINDIHFRGRNGSVNVIGSRDYPFDNSFIAENLRIENRNGAISISNVALTTSLDLETRNANMHLNNVLAPADGVSFTTRNGRVFATE